MAELFNSIGDKVEKVAPTAVPDGTTTGEEEEERVVEEIESLCMNCEENVSRRRTCVRILGRLADALLTMA